MLDARVVDEDVDLAEGVDDARHHAPDGVRLAHVGAVEQHVHPVLCGDPRAQALDGGGLAETVQDDVGATSRERLGDAESDAARGACDDGRPASERALRTDPALHFAH